MQFLYFQFGFWIYLSEIIFIELSLFISLCVKVYRFTDAMHPSPSSVMFNPDWRLDTAHTTLLSTREVDQMNLGSPGKH